MHTNLKSLLCLLTLLTTISVASGEPAAGQQQARTNYLQLSFDFSRPGKTGLNSLKFDPSGQGRFEESEEIVPAGNNGGVYYSVGTDEIAGREGTELPRFAIRTDREDGTVWAVAFRGSGALRYYVVYYLPDSAPEVLGVRQMVRALGRSAPDNVDMRLGHTRVFQEAAFLPDMSPRRTLADSERKVDNTRTAAMIPDEGQAITFWGPEIGMTVVPLAPLPYAWGFRFRYHRNDPDPYGGMLEVPRGHPQGLQAGDQDEVTYLLHFYAGEPQTENQLLASPALDTLKQQALAAMGAGLEALEAAEEQYLQDAAGFNYTDAAEGLKVDLVALQRAQANLELALEDREIVRELRGTCPVADESAARDEVVRAEKLIQRSLRAVARADSLGQDYQAQGTDAITRLQENLDRTHSVVRRQIEKVGQETAALAIAPAWSAPPPPSHVGPWPTDVLWGGVYGRFGDGNDTVQCEMRKAKAAGLDWMEVGWWGYHFPALYDLMKRNDQDKVINLVRPLVEAGLQVEWHTHAKSWGGGRLEQDFPGVIHTESHRPYQLGGTWDFHMPGARQACEDSYRWLGQILHDNFADHIFGFTYECETRFWTMPTPDARRPFTAWLQAKYQDVAGLNAAWKSEYASWEDLRAQLDVEVVEKSGRVGPGADWLLFSQEAWADQVMGAERRGCEAGCPGKVYATRGTYIPKNFAVRAAANVIGEHTKSPWLGEFGARATGLPWFNSEWWWCRFEPYQTVLRRWGEEAAKWYAPYADPNGIYPTEVGERACWLSAAGYMLEEAYLGAIGYNLFMWASGEGSDALYNFEDRRNGLLRSSSARVCATADEVRKLRPLLLATQPQTDVAVLWTSTAAAIDRQPKALESSQADIALQTLHVDHDALYEEQVLEGRLRDYKVLWLAATQRVPDQVQERIAEWVKAGGKLVISGLFGTKNELGNPSGRLLKAIGLEFGEQVEAPATTYPGRALSLDFLLLTEGRPPREVESRQWNDLTWGPRPEKQFYTLAGPAAAKVIGTYGEGQPALLSWKVGSGQVVASGYCLENVWWAWAFGKNFPQREHFVPGLRQVMESALQAVGYQKPYEVNLPAHGSLGPMVSSVRRAQPGEAGYYLFLVNRGARLGAHVGRGTDMYVPETAEVTVSFAEPVRRVYEVVRGVDLPIAATSEDTAVTFTIRPGRPYVLKVD